MLRTAKSVFAMLVMAGFATQASAGGSLKDDEDVAPIFAPVVSWTGCYLGGHAGYAWGEDKWRVHDDPTVFNQVDQPFDIDVKGGIVGGQVGCNYQMNQLVIGGEASISVGNVHGSGPKDIGTSVTQPYVDSATETLTGRYSTKAEFDNIFRAVLRVGYAVNQWHWYVKGGYAGADVRKCIRGEFTTVYTQTVSVSTTTTQNSFCNEKWHNGYTLGFGNEYMATQNIVLGIDYSFVDLGREAHKGFDRTGDFYDIWNEGDVHKLTARVSYKFGVAPVPVPLK